MERSKQAWLCALTAYLLWGLLPIYWKFLDTIPPTVVLAHRTIWSIGLLIPLFLLKPQLLSQVTVRTCLFHLGSALVLGLNWGVYIWSVSNGFILAASLGYFCSPLLYIAVGALFFQEVLSTSQKAAVALGGLALLLLAVGSDIQTCSIAALLASSIVVYGLFSRKRTVPLWTALALESLLLSLPAAWYLCSQTAEGFTTYMTSWQEVLLLVSTGPATMIPLLFYAGAITTLPFKTFGFLQYLAPTLQFLLAVFIYHEVVEPIKVTSFSFVWGGIILVVLTSGNVRLRQYIAAIRRHSLGEKPSCYSTKDNRQLGQ